MEYPTTILEWRFSPPELFEEIVDLSTPEYSLSIEHGLARAEVSSEVYDVNPHMRDELHARIYRRMLGVQLLSHIDFQLPRASISKVSPNGQKVQLLEPEPANVGVSVGAVDIQVLRANGSTVSDTRAERIELKRNFAEWADVLASKEPLLMFLLGSYRASVKNPANELVYIFDIRDALKEKFGSERLAKSQLGVSDAIWGELGRLCNDAPFWQGRHRGTKSSNLRDATEQELLSARSLAVALIEAYVAYLRRPESHI